MTDEAWTEPAGEELVAQAVTKIVQLVQPSRETDEEWLQAFVGFVVGEGYTEGEIRHAAAALPKDEHLDNKLRYGRSFTPADIERVIKTVRRARANLKTSMTRAEMQTAIEMEPALSREDFGKRHDQDNTPVFLLTAEARTRIGID